jgi:hypothetical protein
MSETPRTDNAEFPVMTWPERDNPMVVRSELSRQLERELAEAWHLLNVLCLNMMDDGPTWPRVLEFLRRNERFCPENAER